MRVLEIGNFGKGWDNSICDEVHIADALEQLGHQVYRYQRDAIDKVDYPTDVDFVLIAQWYGYPERLFTNLRALAKCPIVYWAFDYQADGQEWHKHLIEGSNLYLSKRITDSVYRNWQWLSQDFAPWFMNRYNEKPERDIDVLFTGSYLPWAVERNATLRAIDRQFNLQINSVNEWPNNFKNVQGPVMDKDYTALVARSKINIAIDHTLEAGYWSDRAAQIMACGGFVMMRYIPLMESRFRDKVVYFYSQEDCLQKIAHYLDGISGETARKVLGSVGYSYAQENLMVKNRVQDLLTIVENYIGNSTFSK